MEYLKEEGDVLPEETGQTERKISKFAVISTIKQHKNELTNVGLW